MTSDADTTNRAALYMSLKVAGAAIAFVSTILFGRILGPREYGVMSLVVVSSNLVATLVALGLPYLLTRDISIHQERSERTHISALVRSGICMWAYSSAVGTIVIFATYLFVRDYLWAHEVFVAFPLVLLGTILVPLVALNQIRSGMLRGIDRIISADLPEMLLRQAVILVFVIVLIAVDAHADAITAVEIQLIGVAVACGSGLYFLRRSLKAELRRSAPLGFGGNATGKAGSLLRQAPHFLVITLVAMTDSQVSLYVIGALIGATGVGIYQAALQPLNIILMGLVAASVSVQPRIAAAWSARRKADAQALISRATRFSSGVSVLIGLPLIVFADFIYHLYGIGFQTAGILLRILTVAQIIRGLTGPIGIVLLMTGHQRRLFYFDVAFLCLKIALVATGLHYFGLLGAAIGEAGYLITERIAGVVLTYKLTGLLTVMWKKPRDA